MVALAFEISQDSYCSTHLIFKIVLRYTPLPNHVLCHIFHTCTVYLIC